MPLIKDVLEILKGEPEEWLNYHLGQQLHNDPHFARTKKRFAGVWFRVLILAYFAVRNFGIKARPERAQVEGVDYIVFANTINQIASLETTIRSLRQRSQKVLAITDKSLMGVGEVAKDYTYFSFGPTVHLVAIAVFLIRFLPLRKRLLDIHPSAVDYYLNSFLEVYWYLSYFHQLLSGSGVKFAITSNDHNTANRCLMAAAQKAGVKTVYLQHASVSELFPALRFDYAFLDGQSALDVYRACESNQPETRHMAPVPVVFLSGQKKRVRHDSLSDKKHIGLALNALDDTSAAIDFVNYLVGENMLVCLRWHPGHPKQDVDQFRSVFMNNPSVRLSDPFDESISGFMGMILRLVAGNSSIHLEAVLSGVPSIYFELTSMDNPDYYGYVRHGVVDFADCAQDVVELLQNDQSSVHQKVDAIRYFSATYGTPWYDREGELVAESLMSIAAGRGVGTLFGEVPFYKPEGVRTFEPQEEFTRS